MEHQTPSYTVYTIKLDVPLNMPIHKFEMNDAMRCMDGWQEVFYEIISKHQQSILLYI